MPAWGTVGLIVLVNVLLWGFFIAWFVKRAREDREDR